MIHSFAAFLGTPGNEFFRDKIEIDDNKRLVTYYKKRVFGYDSMVIPINNISSVRVDAGVIFSDVIIEAFGGRTIEVNGFLRSDANEIAHLLTH